MAPIHLPDWLDFNQAIDYVLYAAGPRSSAVVGGYTHLHAELESRLAALKGTEACLLCPTGFAANMAVLTALCSDGGAVIFSDELNHASIIDGARLAARSQVSTPPFPFCPHAICPQCSICPCMRLQDLEMV